MVDDIKAIARRTLEEIFPNADGVALGEVIHPDCFNHELPPGMPQGIEGMTKLMLWLNGAFTGLHYDIHQVIADAANVVVYCTMTGRHTGEFMGIQPTNRDVAFRQIHIVRFKDGKAIEHWAVRDDLTMVRQLGVRDNASGSNGNQRVIQPT
jgi:predicted ester cyclase